MATLTDLPNELIQEIMNHVPPNTSLTSLSLISRSWFQYLLNRRFTRIRLDSKNISRFLVLLRSPLCTFLQGVRHLYIHWSAGEVLYPDQGIIYALLTRAVQVTSNRVDHTPIPIRATHPKSIFSRFKISTKARIPAVEECHVLNIVCLFPSLEHLQVELMALVSNIPYFPRQPPIPPALKSVSIICNDTPPPGSSRQDKWDPPEWKCFLKWVRSNGIYAVQRVYITRMEQWDYRAAETFINLQGTSLKHLHLGLQAHGSITLHPNADLESLHFGIMHPKTLSIAANILSQIAPGGVRAVGLDVLGHQLVRDAAGMKALERLSHELSTRGFTGLRRILVRMEGGRGSVSHRFEEAARIVRRMFPGNLLALESLSVPFGTIYMARDVVDDCGRWEGGDGGVSFDEIGPIVPIHQDPSISHFMSHPPIDMANLPDGWRDRFYEN